MFKIGDKVTVNHSKKCFPYAQDIADLMELTCWRFGAYPMPHDVCTVVGKSYLPNSGAVAYGIDDGKHQFIIGEEGISTVPTKQKYKIKYEVIVSKQRCIYAHTSDEALNEFRKMRDDFLAGERGNILSIEAQ